MLLGREGGRSRETADGVGAGGGGPSIQPPIFLSHALPPARGSTLGFQLGMWLLLTGLEQQGKPQGTVWQAGHLYLLAKGGLIE